MFLLLFCLALILISTIGIIYMNTHITDYIDAKYELELVRKRVNSKNSLF